MMMMAFKQDGGHRDCEVQQNLRQNSSDKFVNIYVNILYIYIIYNVHMLYIISIWNSGEEEREAKDDDSGFQLE